VWKECGSSQVKGPKGDNGVVVEEEAVPASGFPVNLGVI